LAYKDWEKLPFDQQKKMLERKLEQKSAMIQEARTCVNKATDKTALKVCQDDMKNEKQAMEEQWQHKKKQVEESQEGLKVE